MILRPGCGRSRLAGAAFHQDSSKFENHIAHAPWVRLVILSGKSDLARRLMHARSASHRRSATLDNDNKEIKSERPSKAAACAGSASDPKFVSHPAFTRALAALHRHVLPGGEADEEASLQETSIPRGGATPHIEIDPICSQ